jgi:hypothetical protein
MLPFGSITSIIPLFVLGFAYLLYFSTSLLSKPEAGADHLCIPVSESTKKEITVTPEKQASYPLISFSIRKDNSQNSADAVEFQNLFKPDLIILSSRLPDLQKHVLKPFHFHFSVRPPPAR